MDRETKIKRKLKVMELEKDNFDKLIIFESTNGFYKIAGNSAIFYAGNIARRIGRRFLLRSDEDFYAKSEPGIISVKLNEELIERLEAIEVVLDKDASVDGIFIFRLKQSFSEKDLEYFKEQIFQDNKLIDKLTLPKSPIPTLFNYFKELNELIYYGVREMPAVGREVVGKELFEAANDLLVEYTRGANEGFRSEKIDFLSERIRLIKYQMKNVEILHLIPARNIVRILEKCVRAEQILIRLAEKTG